MSTAAIRETAALKGQRILRFSQKTTSGAASNLSLIHICDTAALSAMLSRVLSSPQGAELVQRLESKLQQ